MRNTFGKLFLACASVGMMVGTSFGDTIVGDFNLDSNLNPISSVGEVTFSLNGNGTIAATLVSNAGGINGFGFNSVAGNLPESNFTPPLGAFGNHFGWEDTFGTQNSGFYSPTAPTTETWTIGNPGDFTSVFQALGGARSSVDFYLLANSEYGAQAHATSAVPEPSSLALLGLGGIGLAIGAYRRRRTAAV